MVKTAGIYFSIIAIITILAWGRYANTQTFRNNVRSLTNVPSRSSLENLLGKPDAITYPTPRAGSNIFISNYSPGIELQPPSTVFTYSGPERLRIRWSKKFPFVKALRSKEYTYVHIYRKDQMAYTNQLNKDYPWRGTGFHHAIVGLDAESSEVPRDLTEESDKDNQ
jgi:hypothetical protein